MRMRRACNPGLPLNGKIPIKDAKMKETPNLHILKLTFIFFATGMLMFLAAMVAALLFIPDLVRLQSLRNPQGWALAHLLLLGFATTIAMGASFQITQVILRTALFSRGLGYIHYVFYLLGFTGLMAGFCADAWLIALGGGCLAVGAALYVFNLIATFVRKKEWNVFVFGVSLCLAEFLFAICLGIAMGLGYARGWNAAYHSVFLAGHLWFGVGGWLSGLILVYSFKLLPMFYASRKGAAPSAYWILGIYHLGVWLQFFALPAGAERIGGAASLLMLIALGWFCAYMFQVRKLSSGRLPIGAVKVAFFLIPAAGLLFFVWSVLRWTGSGAPQAHDALIISVILGWFAASILSYLSKILPFLWWAHRFRATKKSPVLLTEMLPEKRMTRQLYGYLAGIAATVSGYLFESPLAAISGQAIAVVFVLIYLAELLRVFRY